MAEPHREASMRGGIAGRFIAVTAVGFFVPVALAIVFTGFWGALVMDLGGGNMVRLMGFGAAAVTLLLVPLAYVWRSQLNRMVLGPLRDLGGVMEQASRGDLTIRSAIESQNEVGMLAAECNNLIESLESIAGQVRASAEGVSGAASQLSASAQEINSSTMEISSSVQGIAHGAELQSRKVEETSAAMESITGATNEMATQSQQASVASEEAARFALEGEQATNEAIAKMSEVAAAIETLAGSVTLLGKRSTEIGEIVYVITSIAEQTNLLSLNAAIEAARAGESGRGFSVVAEEVRKLADGSANAAEKIGDLIKEVQEETAKAVDQMEVGTSEVALGTQVVDKTGEALRNITESVSRTAMLAEQIAHATAEQKDRMSAVDRAVHDIASVVEENAASAEQTAAAAEEQTACMQEVSAASQELAEMAQRLDDSVHLFRIGQRQ